MFTLKHTVELRGNITSLLITLVKPSRKPPPQTISHWNPKIIHICSSNLDNVKVHSIRAVSTSRAHIQHLGHTYNVEKYSNGRRLVF